MNGESVGIVCVREATRQHKSCAFKRAMLKRLAEFRDLNKPPENVLGSSLMLTARLSGNIQYPEEII